MSDQVAYRLRIAGEDRAHHVAVREISRAVLTQVHAWLDGLPPDDAWEREPISSATKRYGELFPKRFGPRHGQFEREPGGPDAAMVRAQLLLWHHEGWPFHAAFIARDTDGDPRRARGARQAVDAFGARLQRPVLLAYAAPEAEAWIVAGFEATSDEERAELRRLVDDLHFDPTRQPSRLTSKHTSDLKDSKRVCRALTNDDREREVSCLQRVAHLEHVDPDTGLPEFLDAVRDELAPTFTR